MGKVSEQIIIRQPVDEVWQTIRNFYDMAWAKGVANEIQVDEQFSGTEIGAERKINGAFKERLILLDDNTHSFAYEIIDGPGPLKSDRINNYIGRVELSELPEGTRVVWSATFDAKDNSLVEEFCGPMYRLLLSAMKNSVESKQLTENTE